MKIIAITETIQGVRQLEKGKYKRHNNKKQETH